MSAESCNLCGAALVAQESIDAGSCWPSCDDLEFDRLVAAGFAELEACHPLPWPGPRGVSLVEAVRPFVEIAAADFLQRAELELKLACEKDGFTDDALAAHLEAIGLKPRTIEISGTFDDPPEPEPGAWQCAECGEIFDRPDVIHGQIVPRHSSDCGPDGCSSSCPQPLAIECGPLERLPDATGAGDFDLGGESGGA